MRRCRVPSANIAYVDGSIAGQGIQILNFFMILISEILSILLSILKFLDEIIAYCETSYKFLQVGRLVVLRIVLQKASLIFEQLPLN